MRKSTAHHFAAGTRLTRSRGSRIRRFIDDTLTYTWFIELALLLLVLWLAFSALLLVAESNGPATAIASYREALYWSIAAMSTAGIASEPQSGLGHLIGGTWMIIGPMLFFGTIVSSITGYFTRPLQRPARQIIETIEYNLEHLQDLEMDELDLLKETTDALIEHVERMKQSQ